MAQREENGGAAGGTADLGVDVLNVAVGGFGGDDQLPGDLCGGQPGGSQPQHFDRLRTTARPEIEQAVDEALKAAEFEVVTLDWDGFATGTNIFTTIFLAEVWDTDHALAEAHPDGVGDDIHQTLSMTELFRPGLDDARNQLADWRQTLLDLFGQVELLALPTLPAFPPRLEDLTPESLVNAIIEITQYTGLFNAAGTPCTA
jgi:Asp-tRNA(Asn)/Glu-tRNA(Gln) amidotransferase A subunit family amidase